MRRLYTEATADPRHAVSGVAVVGSRQTLPPTDRPWKVRGVAATAKTLRTVEIALSDSEAAKLVADWTSMGLVVGASEVTS